MATLVLARAQQQGRFSKRLYWAVIILLWVLITLAMGAETGYLLIEEPRRIAAGEPID